MVCPGTLQMAGDFLFLNFIFGELILQFKILFLALFQSLSQSLIFSCCFGQSDIQLGVFISHVFQLVIQLFESLVLFVNHSNKFILLSFPFGDILRLLVDLNRLLKFHAQAFKK